MSHDTEKEGISRNKLLSASWLNGSASYCRSRGLWFESLRGHMSTRTFTLYVCIQYSVCCLYTCKEFIYFDHRSCKNLSTMSNDRKVFRRRKKKAMCNFFDGLKYQIRGCTLRDPLKARSSVETILRTFSFKLEQIALIVFLININGNLFLSIVS